MKVDLITGFLGAGKTTFIRRYIRHLQSLGQRVHIIENEFGVVNADTKMLKEETDADISDLTGVCMCCEGELQFKQLLLRLSAEGCDRILVEPSGIYDVDEFFVLLSDPVLQGACEIGCILTIMDAKWNPGLTDEAMYLVFSQLLAAGTVVISKSQLYTPADVEETAANLNRLLAQRGVEATVNSRLFVKNWDDLTAEDFAQLQASGYNTIDHARLVMQHGDLFSTRAMNGGCLDEKDLQNRIEAIFAAPETYGAVFRIKGHIRDKQKVWYELNCTQAIYSCRPVQIKRGMFVVIGQNLNPDALDEAFLTQGEMKR